MEESDSKLTDAVELNIRNNIKNRYCYFRKEEEFKTLALLEMIITAIMVFASFWLILYFSNQTVQESKEGAFGFLMLTTIGSTFSYIVINVLQMFEEISMTSR